MATFFSDHFSADGVQRSVLDHHQRPDGHRAYARTRYAAARVTVQTSDNDTIRFLTLHSGDHIMEVWGSSDGAPGAGLMDLGIALTGSNHDGAMIDSDMWASGFNLASGRNRADVFSEAPSLENEDRAKSLWELAVVAGATYTEDPLEQWDIVGTTTTGADAATEILIEVFFTSGS